jgi:polyribonucleotide nucleotidyltransferase
MKINPDKIRDVIGKGGAVIRADRRTSTQINIGKTARHHCVERAAPRRMKPSAIAEITAELSCLKVYE